MKETPKTTCQICGRPIKANTGLIAHHGYTRPDSGWQTNSCFGARGLPYEQSCDLIPEAIENIKQHIEATSTNLKDFLQNPPETLKHEYRGYAATSRNTSEISKPVDFDPNSTYRSYRFEGYDTLFYDIKHKIEQDIEWAERDLAFLINRLNEWKNPNVNN